jgi:nicotinate-nucleotide pyrophosphorylase (carboxylating)
MMSMPVESTFAARETQLATWLVQLGLQEDLGDRGDITSQALVPGDRRAEIAVVARQPGVLAGSPVARLVWQQLDPTVSWRPNRTDGDQLQPGDVIAIVAGTTASLLTGERTVLNFLTHLSGIATFTSRFVEAIDGLPCVLLDTRKTHPGYRLLEKYAVRCGGGTNHRLGLYDGVLIKDNHLAAWQAGGDGRQSIAAAVQHARKAAPPGITVEVEVDTLEQLADALNGQPEIVLLDNMSVAQLRQAVELRDRVAPQVLLEASGGVSLATVRSLAETGVDRISCGALTHSAPALDIAFDWSTSLTQ